MFKRVDIQIVDAKHNRARALVPWVNGKRKVIAGFVNPKGRAKRPLRSRSHKGKLQNLRTAIAPSVASMVKEYYREAQLNKGADRLLNNLSAELEKEVIK